MSEQIERRRCIHYNEDGEPWRESGCQYADCAHIHPDRSAEEAALWPSARAPKPALPSYIYNVVHPEKENARREMKRQKLMAWRKERRAARVAAKARARAEKDNDNSLEEVVIDGSRALHEEAANSTPRPDVASADVATAAVPDDWETDHEAPDAEDAPPLSKQAPIKRGGSHRKPAKLTGKELKRKRNKRAARLRLISLCATSATTLNTLASEIKKNEALLDSLNAPNTINSESYDRSTSPLPSLSFNYHNLPEDVVRETRLRLEREQTLLLARLEEEKARNDVMRAKLIGMTVLGAVPSVEGTKDENEGEGEEVDEEEDVDVDEVCDNGATAQEVTETKTDTNTKPKAHLPSVKQKITAAPSTSTSTSTAKQPTAPSNKTALQEDQQHRSKRKSRRKKSKNKGKNRKSRNAPGDEDNDDGEDAEDGEIVDAALPEAPEEGEIEVEDGDMDMGGPVKVEPKVEEEADVDVEGTTLEHEQDGQFQTKAEPGSDPAIDIDLEAIDAQARLPTERTQTQTERQTTQRLIKDVRAWMPRLGDKVAMLQDALGEVYALEVDRYYRTMEDLAVVGSEYESTTKRKRVDGDEEGQRKDIDIDSTVDSDSRRITLSPEETAEAIRADRQQFNHCRSDISRIWTTTQKIPFETGTRTADALRVAIDGIRAEREQRAQELQGQVQEMVKTSSAEIAVEMKPQLEWALLQGVALAPRVSGRRETVVQLKAREESLQEVVGEEKARRDDMRKRVDQMKTQLKSFSDLRAQNKASIESLRSTIDECVKKAESVPLEDIPPPPPPPQARLPTARLVEALLASVSELARPQVQNTQSEAQAMLNQNSTRLVLTLDARIEQTCKIAEDLTRKFPLQALPPATRMPKLAQAPAPAHPEPQVLARATVPPVSFSMTKLANRSPLNPPAQKLPPPPAPQPTALEASVLDLPRSSPIDFQSAEGYAPPPPAPMHRAAYATTGVARSSSSRATVDTYVQHLIPPSSQQGPAPQSVFPLPHHNAAPPAINSHNRSAPPAPAPLAHQHTTMSASRPHQSQHPNKDISLPNMGAPHHPAGPAPVQPVVPSNASDCSFLTYPGVQGIPVLLRLKNSNPGTSRSFIFVKVVHVPPSSGAAYSQGSAAPMVEIRDVNPGPQNGKSYQISIDSLTYVPPTGVHQTVICTIPGMNHAQLYAILQLGGNSECILCKRDQPYGNRMHCETRLLAQVATMPPPAPPAPAPGNSYPPPNQPAQLVRQMAMRPYPAPPANRPVPVKIHPTHSPTWLKDFVFSGKRVQLIELGGDGSILEFIGVDAFQSAVYVDARHTSNNPRVRMIPLESLRHIIPSVPSQCVVPICGGMKGVIHVVGTYGHDQCRIYSPGRPASAYPYRTTDLAVVRYSPGTRGAGP